MENLIILSGFRASHFVLVAVGFALVFGSCRILNLMHGAYVMIGAYGTYAFLHMLAPIGIPRPGVLVLATLFGALGTAGVGFAFFRALQLTKRTESNQVLAISVAGNLFVASIVAYFCGSQGVNVPPMLEGTVRLGRVSVAVSDLMIPAVAAVAVCVLWAWLHKTGSGTALRAVADNESAARLMGINPGRTLARAVAVAAFLAGLAGALMAPSQTLMPDMWVHPLLVSFAVVVLGGRNSLGGAVLGACLLGVVETLTAWYWSEAASEFVALAAIVIGLFCLPTGLVESPQYENR